MYLSHHCITLGHQFRNSLPDKLNSAMATFIDYVHIVRKCGTDCFLQQLVGKKYFVLLKRKLSFCLSFFQWRGVKNTLLNWLLEYFCRSNKFSCCIENEWIISFILRSHSLPEIIFWISWNDFVRTRTRILAKFKSKFDWIILAGLDE